MGYIYIMYINYGLYVTMDINYWLYAIMDINYGLHVDMVCYHYSLHDYQRTLWCDLKKHLLVKL